MTTTEQEATPEGMESIDSTDLVCEICGKPLSYSGKGRKPKYCEEHKNARPGSTPKPTSAAIPRTGNRDVDAACAVLHGAYETALYPISVLSPNAGQVWQAQIEGLDTRNRLILSGDPKLARRIVEAASKGGASALVMSHAMAIVPVTMVIAGEVRERRAETMAARQAEAESYSTPYVVDPDAVFANRNGNP